MGARLGIFTALFALSCAGPSRAGLDPDREEGVHAESGADRWIEWWYHFGWLTDESGGEWAWVSSFFRYRHPGAPLTRYQIYDLIDLKTGLADYHSRVGPEALAPYAAFTGQVKLPPPHRLIEGDLREKAGDPLKLAYGDDTLERTGGRTYRLKAGPIDVDLRAASNVMAVEGTGLTGLKRPDDMHYYTIPRLVAEGSVRGKKARGLFWYDHQWGTSWVGVGWSWWGLQLEGGTHVNAYVLRDVKSGAVLRSVLTHDGGVVRLDAKPVDWWESPAGVNYPIAWELSGGPFRLSIEPLFRERACAIFGALKEIWEGPVRVKGSHSGRGFQELVGYARDTK